MKVHEIKSERGSLAAVADGVKCAELRLDDREYALGDYLLMREWSEGAGDDTAVRRGYGGMSVLARVTHIVMTPSSFNALESGYVMLSLKVLDVRGR